MAGEREEPTNEIQEFPLVCSVVVNYRDPEDTKRCLRSVCSLDYERHETVVVNNDDDFGGANDIAESFPECTVIVTGENLGFSSGFNTGIEFALEMGADVVSILNNDIVVDEAFLKAGMKTIHQEDNVGIVGGKIYKYDDGPTNTIWTAGGKMSWLRARGVGYGFGEKDWGQCDEKMDVEFIPGAQMLVRRDVFERVGLLPEAYFLGGEEWEFCHKVREAGYTIRYEPSVVAWHKVTYSSKDTYSMFYNDFRNRLLYTYRCYSMLGWLVWLIVLLVFAHTWLWVKYHNNRPGVIYIAAMRALYRTIVERSFQTTRAEYEAALHRD